MPTPMKIQTIRRENWTTTRGVCLILPSTFCTWQTFADASTSSVCHRRGLRRGMDSARKPQSPTGGPKRRMTNWSAPNNRFVMSSKGRPATVYSRLTDLNRLKSTPIQTIAATVGVSKCAFEHVFTNNRNLFIIVSSTIVINQCPRDSRNRRPEFVVSIKNYDTGYIIRALTNSVLNRKHRIFC